MTYKIAIVGAGPTGCMVACNLNKDFEITLFDKNSPLKTLLPTGGGKCNLAHAEYDFKKLAKSYPRGEKFLYSVFSRFSTYDTIDFFEKIGVKTYTREDERIFPISNSSQDVREKILNQLHKCKFQHEEVLSIKKLQNGFELKTNKASYLYDYIVVTTGGKSGYTLLTDLGHNIDEPKPSLVGVETEPSYKELQGVTVENCTIKEGKQTFNGNILFTDKGLTGPAIFELSSINARKEMPYKIYVDFVNKEFDLQQLFDSNPHKNLGNLLNNFLPKSCINEFCSKNNIDTNEKCHAIRSNTKVLVKNLLTNHEFTIKNTRNIGEIVTCGGILLNEINPKTFESKIISGIYIGGEVLDIDGFCGGYNLQYCWSCGYIIANSLNILL